MGWVYTSIKIEGAFFYLEGNGRRKRAGRMLFAAPGPPQVTAAAGKLGGDLRRCGVRESQRGRGCSRARELKVGLYGVLCFSLKVMGVGRRAAGGPVSE